MKKPFVLTLVLFIFFPSFAQSLAYRHDKDSYLQMATDYKFDSTPSLFSMIHKIKQRTGVSLVYHLNKESGKESFILDFLLQTYKYEFSFDKNSNVYIKTFQDNLIILQQREPFHSIKTKRELIDDDPNMFLCSVYPSYFISKEDLKTIMEEGIKKMSFMTTREYYTISFEEDSLGKIIKDEYNLLLGKSDFTEGF